MRAAFLQIRRAAFLQIRPTLVVSLLLLAPAAACGAGSSRTGTAPIASNPVGTGRTASATTRLAITVYPREVGQPRTLRYRLACDSPRGTVPHPAHACRVLARLAHPFAPVQRGRICSDIMLGPQQAFVTGVLRGQRVNAHLTVRGSCEIDRWRAVRAVVPGFPGP
jgi:hypothetical protein